MNYIITGIIALTISVGGFFGLQALPDETLGAFGDPFISIQVATTSIAAGNILSSVDAVNNEWITCATLTGSADLCDGDDGGGALFAWTPYTDGVSTSTLLRFDAGFISNAASSTIAGTLTIDGALSASSTANILGVLTMGGNIVSDTDSTDDLGSSAVAWNELYVDDIIGGGEDMDIKMSTSDGADSDRLGLSGGGALGNTRGALIILRGNEDSNAGDLVLQSGNASGGEVTIAGGSGTSVFRFDSGSFYSTAASAEIGQTTDFFDEGYFDELVLLNVGTNATAANTVRLGGQDIDGGDAALLVVSEDDTEHIFGTRSGFASTSPWAQLSLEMVQGVTSNDVPAFVIADQGTSTPAFLIDAVGNVAIGLFNNIVAKLQVAGDVWFHDKVDIGVPGTAGGLDVGEGGSYTTDKDGTTIVQIFTYDASAAGGSRFTEAETTDTVTWNAVAEDRFYVCSQIKFWGVRFTATQAKSTERLTMSYYDGTSTTSMDYMGILKDAATSTGETVLEQILEKEYVTWDRNINNLWATADNVADTIPDVDADSYCVYFEVPTGGLATPVIHTEVKARGNDIDIISGTPYTVLWGQARLEKHDRISLSIVRAPGGTATADVDIDQNHKQTVFDFDTAGDDVTFLWTLPEGIDTSSGIELTLDYSADAADTFDLDLYAKKLQEGTTIGSTIAADYLASTTITTAAGSVFHINQTLTPTLMSIQDMSPNEVISFELERTDATNSLFPFTIVVRYTSFAGGEHVKK